MTTLDRHLRSKILIHGPISVGDYMKEVLVAPVGGYYTDLERGHVRAEAGPDRAVFGKSGDFVTAPDISQMFGELLAVWCVSIWDAGKRPSAIKLVELGPGRGTMMADMLRAAKAFPEFHRALEVGMVEASEPLRLKQSAALEVRLDDDYEQQEVMAGFTDTGVRVKWHRHLAEVMQPGPEGERSSSSSSAGEHEAEAVTAPPVIILAHEFFDALPVNQFQKTDKGWCDVLVDVDEDPLSPSHFRFVLAREPSPVSAAYMPFILEGLSGGADGDAVEEALQGQVEVSPEALSLVTEIAKCVGEGGDGSASLIIDYGANATYADSLQAIRDHQYFEPLENPGTADLSCSVDFKSLGRAAADSGAPISVWGGVPQTNLLASLGIQARVNALASAAGDDEATARRHFEAAQRLVDSSTPQSMGQLFKCLAIVASAEGVTSHTELNPPPGFDTQSLRYFKATPPK